MSPEIVFPGVAIGGLLPALIVLAAAGLVLLLDLAPPRDTKTHLGGIALTGEEEQLLVRYFRDPLPTIGTDDASLAALALPDPHRWLPLLAQWPCVS